MEAIRPHLDSARAEAIRWLGDWHPLVRQIAPGKGVIHPHPSSSPHAPHAVVSRVSLQTFLTHYKVSVLLPFELPAVRQACEHTVRNEMNELLALDRTLSTQDWLKPYQQDSRAAGLLHLESLKPLRDQRGIRRYIAAVEAGEGNGWHLLVAGAALGLYSVPLRQGLMDYALHTFWNVVGQAAGPLGLESDEAIALVNDLGSDLPEHIQALFPAASLKAV
jgi:urease accessory protein UreF